MTGHDFMAQVLIYLGQYVIDNADNLAGKAVGLAPVVIGTGGVVAGFVEGAFFKVALKAAGGALTGLFAKKDGTK